MKNFFGLVLVLLLTVACGSGGAKPCSVKQEVKQILTGVKQGCSGSGLIKAAISEEELESVNETFVHIDENNSVEFENVVVVHLKGPTFYLIQSIKTQDFSFVFAFKGNINDFDRENFSLDGGVLTDPGGFKYHTQTEADRELFSHLEDDNIIIFDDAELIKQAFEDAKNTSNNT